MRMGTNSTFLKNLGIMVAMNVSQQALYHRGPGGMASTRSALQSFITGLQKSAMSMPSVLKTQLFPYILPTSTQNTSIASTRVMLIENSNVTLTHSDGIFRECGLERDVVCLGSVCKCKRADKTPEKHLNNSEQAGTSLPRCLDTISRSRLSCQSQLPTTSSSEIAQHFDRLYQR
jgi:hypothetical protein